MPEGRNERGQFAKGCKGGPGSPRRETEENYLKLTVAKTTPDKWAKIVVKAINQAIGGDHRARQWLGDILIGKYVQADVFGPYTESAFLEVLSIMDGFIPDEHREAYEESLKALSEKMEER